MILPLRSNCSGVQKRAIVIISNDNIDGDTYIWPEINRFTDIYIIRGSALNPAILDNAMAHKAKSIIIIATQLDSKDDTQGRGQRLDAGSIFMYKQIEAKHKNVCLVTELESMGTIGYLVKENDEIH